MALLPTLGAQASDSDPTANARFDPQSTDNLDSATLATMRRQEALQPALQAIGDEQMKSPNSGYAGVAFEGDGLTLYWKGALTPGMAAAVGAGRRVGPVTIKFAPFSLAELQVEGNKIESRIKQLGATDIQSVGYAPDGTGLHVTRQPTATTATFAEARERTGKVPIVPADQLVAQAKVTVPVTFETASTPLRTASRTSDTSPWNGGGRWTNTTKQEDCTTGFGVHSNGHSYVLTAAHCASDGDNATEHGVFMGPIYYDDWAYDILLIDSPGWHIIFDGTPSTNTTKNVNSWGYWAANETVCQSGATSGTRCGIQEQESLDIMWPKAHPDTDGDYGYTVYGEIQSFKQDGTYAGQFGDSGGPVFTLDGTGVRAKGTFSAFSDPNLMYFQDWATILSRFAAYPNVNDRTT